MIVAFENEELLPVAWGTGRGHAVRIFNPGLLRDGNGWLFAYRVVAEPELSRRIALCRLDDKLRVVTSSQVPFSSLVRFPDTSQYPAQATAWFADPRLYRLQDRLWIYWNSGWHEPINHQFLQEIDPWSLTPVGSPRELVLAGPRQKLEKNWSLFEAESEVYAVYSVNPHRVLRLSFTGSGPICASDFATATRNPGGYAQVHGGLRGGAAPQRVENHFYSFCHSIENDPAGYRYVAAVYRFQATAPFQPTDMPHRPLPIEVPSKLHRKLRKLNPAVGEVVYPAGAGFVDGRWFVSIGIDDERSAIAVIDQGQVVQSLAPVH